LNGAVVLRWMSGSGPSRHFAAAQQPYRFWSDADIKFDASHLRLDVRQKRLSQRFKRQTAPIKKMALYEWLECPGIPPDAASRGSDERRAVIVMVDIYFAPACDAVFTRPQVPFSSASGRKAWSAGIVSRTLK
jgi:hypothetical protein